MYTLCVQTFIVSPLCMYIITFIHDFRVFKCAQCLLSFSGGFLLSFFLFVYVPHVCALTLSPVQRTCCLFFSYLYFYFLRITCVLCVCARAGLHACVSVRLDVRPRACCLAAELTRPSLLTLTSPSPPPSPCVCACVCECVRV